MDPALVEILRELPVVGVCIYLLLKQQQEIDKLVEVITKLHVDLEQFALVDFPQKYSENDANHPPPLLNRD